MSTPETLYDGAFRAYKAGRPHEARPLLAELMRLQPTHAPGYLLSAVLHDKADPATALALVDQAVALDPNDGQAWYNLGVFEAEQGRLEPALEAYRRAVALSPLLADALSNGCELLRRLEQFEAALDWADRQEALGSATWMAHLNRAVSLFHLRRFAESETAFAKAKALAPDRPIIDWERFSMMLFQRRFAEAWDDFEQRFACGHLNGVFAYPFPEPLWRGEPLAGKHILVHNEQGLGDQLMFACALDEVIAAAGQVTLVVAPPLTGLFAASFPKARVLPARYGAFAGDHPEPAWLGDLGQVDYQLPIGSLMALLRRHAEDYADPKPYLRPSPEARDRWAGFDAGPGLKVGICWASNPALFRRDSARRATRKSMALETMAPLADVTGVSLVSVLNWPIEPMPPAFEGRLTDVAGRLLSMEDTAALIERLDLVIAVDTSVAHLAGALGKETWVLLHDFADCRWELEADRSYWYRDMRLFRQTSEGDWAGVIERVRAALAQRAAAAAR